MVPLVILEWKKRSASNKIFIIFFAFIYILWRTASGSKGGILDLIMLIFMGWLATGYDTKYIKNKVFIFFVLLTLTAFSLYPVGHVFRKILWQPHIIEQGAWAIFNAAWETILNYSNSIDNYRWDWGLALDISRRLGQFDYLLVWFNQALLFPSFVDMSNIYKSIANAFLPGLPYPDTYFSAYMFKVAYGGTAFRVAIKNLATDMFPIFGYFYRLAGPVCFLPILFLVFFSWAKIYKRYASRPAAFAQRSIILYLGQTLFFSMGVDNFVIVIIQSFCTLCLFGCFRRTIIWMMPGSASHPSTRYNI